LEKTPRESTSRTFDGQVVGFGPLDGGDSDVDDDDNEDDDDNGDSAQGVGEASSSSKREEGVDN